MRYDKKVVFVTQKERTRQPNGTYSPAITVEKEAWANVSDTGKDLKRDLFGDITVQSLTVRIQGHHDQNVDWMEYDNKKWRILTSKRFRHDSVYMVGEF